MTVVRRILLGFAGVLVLVVAIVALGIIELATLQAGIKDYNDSTRAQVEAANTIASSAANMESAVLISVVTYEGAVREEQAARLDSEASAAATALDTITALATANSQTQATIDTLRGQLDQYTQAAREVVSVAETKVGEALELARANVIPMSKQLRENAAALKADAAAYESAEADRLSGNAGLMWLIMAIVAVVLLAVGIVFAVTISRSIRKQLRAAVGEINQSASGLLAVASQVSAGVAQTAAATTETTATVEEVRQTAQLASEKAAEVAESSQNVAKGAEIGRGFTDDSIQAFQGVASQMATIAEAINRLGEQTQTVGDIITTVNDLAEQSNLLSVNASIEAAKAGDQGKGFSVVAQEVKSLAEQSKQAVSQVRSILGEIQKASNAAVESADQGRLSVATSRGHVEDARERTLVLAEDASEAAMSAAQISASNRQQLAGIDQICQALESINQASMQSASGTRQVEEEVKRLQGLAVRLRRLVDSNVTA